MTCDFILPVLRTPRESIFSICSKPVLLIHLSMCDHAGKTRSHDRKGSTSQPSEEDAHFKLRLEVALDDRQVAAKFAQIIRSGNQDLLDGLASLCAEVKSLRAEMADWDATIVNLHGEIQRLGEDYDALEQYGQQNNLHVSGIWEPNL